MEKFKKCKMCKIPLNREIKAKKDPDLCFECAEESRKFSVLENGHIDISKISKPLKKQEKKNWFTKLFK